MSALTRFPTELRNVDNFGVFSDFVGDQSDTDFIDLITDLSSGSGLVVGDEVGGVMTMSITDATDNDEMSLYSANEIFKHANGKPIYARGRFQYAEGNTSAANFAFGLANAPVADTLVDNGGGVRTTGSVFAIYKIDGETVWRCRSGCNSTNTTSISTKTAGGSSYQVLEIEILDYTSTACQVCFSVDGVRLIDSTTGKEIVHTVLYASATEMALFFAGKNGSTTAEVFKCDYMGAWQKR
jgi:hypothetical protein